MEIGAIPVYRQAVGRCAFCPEPAPGTWALTAQAVDGTRREMLPLCPRCKPLIEKAGREGRVLKATAERWFGGHTDGRHFGGWDPSSSAR